MTLPLTEWPLLLTYLAKTKPHIPILWGAQYTNPSFTRATPEDRNVLVLLRDVRLRHLPPIVKVKAEWLTVRDVATLNVAELDEALLKTEPGTATLPEATVASNTVAVAKVNITPLSLVHLLMRSKFLTPVNAWNVVAVRMASLVLERIVTPLLYWLRAQTTSQAEAVDALVSVELSNSMPQVRQDLKDRLTPPPPQSHTKYTPRCSYYLVRRRKQQHLPRPSRPLALKKGGEKPAQNPKAMQRHCGC